MGSLLNSKDTLVQGQTRESVGSYVDSNYAAVQRHNHVSTGSPLDSKVASAGNQSLDSKVRRHRRYAGGATQYFRHQRVYLVYLAVGGPDENIFTRERIQAVHDVESNLLRIPGFADFCYKGYPARADRRQPCSPVKSVVSELFFRPSSDTGGVRMVDDFTDAVRRAVSAPDWFVYTDGHATERDLRSRFLRSEVWFGLPLRGYRNPSDRRSDQEEAFRRFIPTLVAALSEMSTDKVRVLYGGNEIFDYEVSSVVG